MDIITTRTRNQVTRGTAIGINERLKRYRIAEQCAEVTPEIIAFFISIMRGEPQVITKLDGSRITDYPELRDRVDAGERLLNRAFGKPAQALTIDETTRELALKKIVHEVRWMPPDPKDTSNYVPAEAD